MDFATHYSGINFKRDLEDIGEFLTRYYHKIEEVDFMPFTIFRNLHGYKPKTFELLQDFVLYYNAFFVHEREEYQRINDDGEVQTIARVRRGKDNVILEVDTHHLRKYLADKQCYLVRYHDHNRLSKEDIKVHLNKKSKSYRFASPLSFYEVWIASESFSGYKSLSRLMGKDIVAPYPEVMENEEEKFASFMVGQDKQGKIIEATCNEDELSNYFVDTGLPHALTPVFFRPEVLSRYYNEPQRFTVTDSGIICLDLWSLDIDTTDEDLIQVWLADFSKIPYKEQLYWRGFNVLPKGTITQHRWERDFEAKFSDPSNNLMLNFNVAFENIRQTSKSKYNESLFLDLDNKDLHAVSTLHVPLTDEQVEFDQQIQFLAKVTNDSLNVDLLSRLTGLKIDPKSGVKGSLDLLSEFLRQNCKTEDDKQNTMKPFHALQSLRSTGIAHRKGEKFVKTLERYQLANLSNRDRFKKLLADITNSLNILKSALNKQYQ